MHFKAVLFDLDNTLIDFMKLKRMCVENAVDAMIDVGLDMSKEKAYGTVMDLYLGDGGLENQRIFQDFSNKVLGYEDYPIMAAGINAYRKTKISYLEPYPHVLKTLTELHKKQIRLGIVTDAGRMQAWIRISALKIGHLLDAVVTYDDTGKNKPDIAPFKKALEVLEVKPEECLFVGDWIERDIEGASRAGMKTCLAGYGREGDISGAKADFVLEDIKDLLSIIR